MALSSSRASLGARTWTRKALLPSRARVEIAARKVHSSEFLGGPSEHDLSIHHHIPARADPQCHRRALLDENNGHAFRYDGLQTRIELLHDARREPHRRLVQQE